MSLTKLGESKISTANVVLSNPTATTNSSHHRRRRSNENNMDSHGSSLTNSSKQDDDDDEYEATGTGENSVVTVSKLTSTEPPPTTTTTATSTAFFNLKTKPAPPPLLTSHQYSNYNTFNSSPSTTTTTYTCYRDRDRESGEHGGNELKNTIDELSTKLTSDTIKLNSYQANSAANKFRPSTATNNSSSVYSSATIPSSYHGTSNTGPFHQKYAINFVIFSIFYRIN